MKIIVIGAGISGLLTSIVCCQQLHEVVCFESTNLEHISGVHICMSYFANWLEKNLPEFRNKFIAKGGHKLLWGAEILNETDNSIFSYFFDKNLFSFFGTKNLIEKTILECIKDKYNNFNLQLNTEVSDLIWDNNTVIGVITGNELIYADLIIDARGTNSKDFNNIPNSISEENMTLDVYYYSKIMSSTNKYLFDSYSAIMMRREAKDFIYIYPIENQNNDNKYYWMMTIGILGENIIDSTYYSKIINIANNMQYIRDISESNKYWWIKQKPSVKNYIEIGNRNLKIMSAYGTNITLASKQANILKNMLKKPNNISDNFANEIYQTIKIFWKTYQGVNLNNRLTIYNGKLIKHRIINKIIANLVNLSAEVSSAQSKIVIGMANQMQQYKSNFNLTKSVIYGLLIHIKKNCVLLIKIFAIVCIFSFLVIYQ